MSAFSGELPIKKTIWTLLLSVSFLYLTAFPVSAKKPLPGTFLGTIVIDPGHGGHDTGAKGTEGFNEKSVTMTLAQLISDRLQSDYRVILTRNADYWLDIPDRTAVANQEGADLFVSIHAGGSYLKKATGLSVFYFKELLENQKAADAEPTEDEGELEPQPWDTVQARHRTDSIELAGLFHSFFQTDGTFTVNPVEGMPLVVLRGADMPAVLIEIGNLAHPLEGKSLKDTGFLSELADRIKNAVDSYLTKK